MASGCALVEEVVTDPGQTTSVEEVEGGSGETVPGVAAPTIADQDNQTVISTVGGTAPVVTVATPEPDAGERHETSPVLFDMTGPLDAVPPGLLRNGWIDVVALPEAPDVRVSSVQVGELAVEGTGLLRTDPNGLTWRELKLSRGRTGWVPADVAVPALDAHFNFFDNPCSTDGVVIGGVEPNGPTGGGSAGIMQVWQAKGPGCHRIGVVFGEGDGFSFSGYSSSVPGGILLQADGSWARVRLGETDSVSFTARVDTGIFVDSPTSFVARANDGGLALDVYGVGPSRYAMTALENPARLLIDVINDPGAYGTDSVEVAERLGVGLVTDERLGTRLAVDGALEVLRFPATIRGYGDWFEASASVAIADASNNPIEGRAIGPSVWSDERNSFWGISITDYIEALGTFEMTFLELPPETARIFVGSCGEADDDPSQPNWFELPGGYCNYDGIALPVRVLG